MKSESKKSESGGDVVVGGGVAYLTKASSPSEKSLKYTNQTVTIRRLCVPVDDAKGWRVVVRYIGNSATLDDLIRRVFSGNGTEDFDPATQVRTMIFKVTGTAHAEQLVDDCECLSDVVAEMIPVRGNCDCGRDWKESPENPQGHAADCPRHPQLDTFTSIVIRSRLVRRSAAGVRVALRGRQPKRHVDRKIKGSP